jgi:hypothetical protein
VGIYFSNFVFNNLVLPLKLFYYCLNDIVRDNWMSKYVLSTDVVGCLSTDITGECVMQSMALGSFEMFG